MNKFLASLVLAVTLVALLSPFLASAQGPLDCCKIKHKIELDTGTPTAEYCLVNGLAGPAGAACSLGAITCPITLVGGPGSDRWGLFCAIDIIYTLTDWFFYFLIAFAVIMTVWGGFDIMRSEQIGGEAFNKARDRIFLAALGLLIAFLAKMVPALVIALFK